MAIFIMHVDLTRLIQLDSLENLGDSWGNLVKEHIVIAIFLEPPDRMYVYNKMRGKPSRPEMCYCTKHSNQTQIYLLVFKKPQYINGH